MSRALISGPRSTLPFYIALCGRSFPFDGCGGFAGDVVDDPVDAANFIYYAVGYYGEDFVRDS